MNQLYGRVTEETFRDHLNGKKLSEISENTQKFLRYIMPVSCLKETISCFLTEDYIKPDVSIQMGDTIKYVSIKSINGEIVHTENLYSFIDFLKENGIDDYTIETYLLFHFGDGTTDGSGLIRKSAYEARVELDERIRQMNAAFNNNPEFIKAVIERTLFQGVNPAAKKAQYIFHGDIHYGVFMSRSQMMKHLERKSFDFLTCPHIGPLVLKPHARYSGKPILSDQRRKEVLITYPNFHADVKYIMNRYNGPGY